MNPGLERIISATDFSPSAELALRRAAALAVTLSTELHVVHALERGSWLDDLTGSTVPEPLQARLREVATAALDATLDALPAALGATGRLLEQPLHRALPELLQQTPAQLLVMGAHGGGGWQDALLGSTVDRVLRLHRIPVLLVRQPVAGAYRRVALATDFSLASQQAAALALQLTPDATHLLLHASQPPFERSLAFAGLAAEEIEAYRRDAALDAMRELDGFAAALGGSAQHVVPALRAGPPAKVLREFIDEAAIDLAVLGSVGRSPLETGLLGSVSRHAAAGLPCDVLLVPPARSD